MVTNPSGSGSVGLENRFSMGSAMIDDPQVKHMGVVTSYEHAWAGKVKVIGPAVRLSASPPTIERPAPMVGERTEEILHEFGVDKKTIADLETRKVIEQATGLTAR